ncbi:MAG TPA: response regulator [Terriglobales bacterium]|nr:response regulator [Terriglobales bacterium]
MDSRRRILFVDDEESIRLTLPPLLEANGFEVTTAASVQDALAQMMQYRFDVLIADLNIDGHGDGFTVISAMRSTQPEALRFILTGYPAFESALEAIQQQVHEYFVKPTDTEALIDRIRARVASHASREPVPERKRVPEVIKDKREAILQAWVGLVKEDTELGSIPISDADRVGYIPELFDALVKGKENSNANPAKLSAARTYGSSRRRQGYSIGALVREIRLLQQAIGATIQENLLATDLSLLPQDFMRVFGTTQLVLERAAEAFVQQEARASRKTAAGKAKEQTAKDPG